MYAPRRLKDLFKWCEYLFYNSAHVFSALRKFGEYPITEVTYDTTNEALKSKHKYLLENVIRVRELLIKATLDKYVYGNAFISMYQPFIRYLKCPHCNSFTNIRNVSYKFSVRNLKFAFTCQSCGKRADVGEKFVEDRKLMLPRKINFIRWDPKLMDIDHNEVTGDSEYYYRIPHGVIHKVNAGHKPLIDTLPMGFLKAIKQSKPFKFNDDAIFHMKVGGPAGVNPQWGFPPLLPALPLFFYSAILRRANEAIALDHLVPFRIVHPAQSSGNADPVQQISLRTWQKNMEGHFKQYRKDPLHMMWAPIPVGMTQIGGQGRALLTLGEVQEAEKNIVSALGVPMEFLQGGLTKSGMEATLRLIENQLATHIGDLKDLLQWVDDSCSKFLGWEQLRVSMTKFRMVDDYAKQSFIMQLWQAGQQGGPKVVSDTTMAELQDIDLKKEEERIKQETLDNMRQQQDVEAEIKKIQESAALAAQQEAEQQGPQGYNQQQIISEAEGLVQQLLQMDQGTRKSQLHELEVTDYVMYSVVIQRLEAVQQSEKQQATSGM
jgi:transposase-like protein